LYAKHANRGFVILAFPCNQFGRQEPGTNAEIKAFAAGKNATFPMFNKIDVNGPNAHPIYLFLRSKLTGLLGSSIKWNFTKFLVGRDGVPLKRYGPRSFPNEIEPDIIIELDKQQLPPPPPPRGVSDAIVTI